MRTHLAPKDCLRGLLPGLALLLVSAAHAAPTLTVIGSWQLGLTRSALRCRAGSDLTRCFESEAGATTLTVTGAADNQARWRLEVARRDTRWHSSLQLQVRRVGSGAGDGVLRAGLTYQTVETSPTPLLIGCGNRLQIPLQFRLMGFSAQVPAAPYLTALSYSLVDLS